MQHTLQSLTAQVVAVARRNADTFLPWSPLAGLGRASELAAHHPAFTTTVGAGPRGA
ncbi:MAG: hypothetical protein JWQ37_143 [Blastococcus sp.]|jgi:hypothetical protein|nr:hypothetical protein [Blastococcus sp.]